jgi:tetratricopeptide (TPR) repeat protein
MPHVGTRARLLGIFGLATISVAVGLGYAWSRPSADPVGRGLVAYSHRDWEEAAQLARERLKSAGDDLSALRLMARASVQLGRDSSAVSLFHRLGSDAMLAEDNYLLGVALTRGGNNSGGLEVWELARAADPNHADTLLALTRAYFASDRLAAATETGRKLAAQPGWEGRAKGMLGAIQFEINDPEGAIALWQRSMELHETEQGSASSSNLMRKKLARALLQAQRPEDARDQLRIVLAQAPDTESFWLLSRAYLQEGATSDALAACAKASPFRDENPLLPEPARFVGSLACAECHRTTHTAQQSSRHARTFFRPAELGRLDLPSSPISEHAQPEVTHTIRRIRADRLQQETHSKGQVFRAIVDYAFGSGDRGLTLVGRDDDGRDRELRLSYYRNETSSFWDVTSGHPVHPLEAAENLGQPLSADDVRRCLLCHVTNPRAIALASGPEASDRAIGCEKCHGPGGNHLLAVAAKFPDLSIARPTMATGSAVVKLCAGCHSPRGNPVTPDDPTSVRFQGTTLTWSRCYIESGDALDCITCHDPHRNLNTSMAHYESKCLTCHSGGDHTGVISGGRKRKRLAETSVPVKCPVNPTDGCISCHMPAVKNVVPHSNFTDHFIRVHRE